MSVPALPDPQTIVNIEQIQAVSDMVVKQSWTADDQWTSGVLDWALDVETYLRRKGLQGPAQTAARHLERRLGELLGPGQQTWPGKNASLIGEAFDKDERYKFRKLAERWTVVEPHLPCSRSKALKLIDAVLTAQAMKDAEENPPDPPEIIQGDFEEALEEVVLIDRIITDPPYERDAIPLYERLGHWASEHLRDGGTCVVMTGQSWLPEIMQVLGRHLAYHWTAAYLTPGGQAVQVFPKKVNTFWKPLLIYSKGKADMDWFGDVTSSDVNDNDKKFHKWGQSESGMADIVQRFSRPGELVVDPFAGAGTTGVVCSHLGRRFVGAEVNEKFFHVADDRLRA